ncbi:hypothetical protein [Methylorubrum extorquens]|uniref:hypothetical protein n=1 Tax=Methylorubrum extorquens TaxID=408 RepID=UPI00209D3F34|nr:hypothetical protein [Methylorubrum extorquens]MCP1539971.1 hypothetical protein [Methylorubrum extorquens]
MDANTSIAANEAAELDALLGGLEIPDDEIVATQPVSDVEETIVEEPIEETLELEATDDTILDEATVNAIEAEMDLQETRDEIYGSAEATETELDPEAVAPAAPAKKKAAATPKKERTARISVESLPVDAFVLTSDIPDDLEANKIAVLRACPAQKKVKEKFDNILTSIHQGKAPSTYIMDCFRFLVAKGGEITSLDLVAALRSTNLKNGASTYSEGTARSQVGQIMALFPALKIAARDGNKLTLNADSLLAEALKGLLNPATAPVEEEVA